MNKIKKGLAGLLIATSTMFAQDQANYSKAFEYQNAKASQALENKISKYKINTQKSAIKNIDYNNTNQLLRLSLPASQTKFGQQYRAILGSEKKETRNAKLRKKDIIPLALMGIGSYIIIKNGGGGDGNLN